jgi:hypothetical protein
MRTTLAAVVLVLTISAAQAQTGKEIMSCWADAIRYCSHQLAIGPMTIKDCLKADSRVSKACRAVLKNHGA